MSDVSFTPGPAVTVPFGLHRGPSHDDFADWLAEPALTRLTQLSQRVQDLHRQIPDSVDIIELGRAATSHQARITQLIKARGLGGYALPELAPEVVTEKRALDKIVAEKNRLQQLVTARSDKWTVVAQLERRVHEFLRDKNGRLDVVEDVPPEKLLTNGETITAARARYRSKQAHLAGKLAKV